MKDFALDLKTCSKADRKKVIKAAKGVGFKWDDSDRFKTREFVGIYFCEKDNRMNYCDGMPCGVVYQMPQDWGKIQEALGIDTPKDGEVRKSVCNTGLFRFRESGCDKMTYYSRVKDNEFKVSNEKFFGYKNDDCQRKATPEEEKQLIEAEHKNGFHWDGKELIKMDWKEAQENEPKKGCFADVIQNAFNHHAYKHISDFARECVEAEDESQEAKKSNMTTPKGLTALAAVFALKGLTARTIGMVRELEDASNKCKKITVKPLFNNGYLSCPRYVPHMNIFEGVVTYSQPQLKTKEANAPTDNEILEHLTSAITIERIDPITPLHDRIKELEEENESLRKENHARKEEGDRLNNVIHAAECTNKNLKKIVDNVIEAAKRGIHITVR